MKSKVLINPGRRRKIPAHFSWVDHRLVREHYLEKCSCNALALYLFLLTVGDSNGLSYYRDETILKHLHLPSTSTISRCRQELIEAGLISFLGGLYQVLGLDDNLDEENTAKFKEVFRRPELMKRVKNCTDNKNRTEVVSITSAIDSLLGGEQ